MKLNGLLAKTVSKILSRNDFYDKIDIMKSVIQKSLFDLDIASPWQELSNSSISFEKSIEPLCRKRTGSYYTSMDLTDIMMSDLMKMMDEEFLKDISNKRFLEPCVGTGNFVFAYLKHCSSLGLSKNEASNLLENLYVCDINKDALNLYKVNLTKYVRNLFGLELDDSYFATHIGGGLLYDVSQDNMNYIPIEDIFPKDVIKDGFDIIVTNPPYKNLKAERSQYSSEEEYDVDRRKYFNIAKNAKERFSLSLSGTLNLYRLFVEEILTKYSNNNSYCSLLIPSSILSDKSCSDLRLFMVSNSAIKNIRLFPETSAYIDASQSVCSILLKKGSKTTKLEIYGFNDSVTQYNFTVDIEDVVDKKTGNSILILNKHEYDISRQMTKHPAIKDIPYIRNLRGELDITLNKQYITTDKTPFKLLRGRNISYYKTTSLESAEHVLQDFYERSAKNIYIDRPRLICQQIVNMAKARRVSFAPVPKNVVLANSCNFVTLLENNDGVDLYFLLGVLNSSIIDWFFKLTSSNNHINNYEINNFPIPIEAKNKDEISKYVKEFLETENEELIPVINSMVNEAYGIIDKSKSTNKEKGVKLNKITQQRGPLNLSNKNDVVSKFKTDLSFMIPNISQKECEGIVSGGISISEIILAKKPDISKFETNVILSITEKYKGIFNGAILNHTTFKLSDLDLEIIKPIPQGGNWMNIPEETIKKSKRLVTIAKTGGRTTLYGRLDYEKPSYTITTYFNRPGNGTYVHPVHERVLSVREAARLQCFPDSFYFFGNKTDTLKQIGNAVPTLLAYSIGKSIKEKTGCNTSVDLFSGAGGLTYGFKLAGINAVVSNDFFEASCVTLKANCPEIDVTCGDITDEAMKKRIIDIGIKNRADIICGGPPCQGFSLAGYRNADDPRNQMFRHFVDIVSKVNPKVVVFENVEGLLSFQGGETYRNIISLFSELGYEAEGRLLHAVRYGVPQKRKRVIILCIRNDLGVLPSEVYPEEITPNECDQITVRDTIYDLEDIQCSENALYNSSFSSLTLQFFKGEIDAGRYCELIKNKPQ